MRENDGSWPEIAVTTALGAMLTVLSPRLLDGDPLSAAIEGGLVGLGVAMTLVGALGAVGRLVYAWARTGGGSISRNRVRDRSAIAR